MFCNVLAHLSHLLMVSYCDRWMSVVRRASWIVRRLSKGHLLNYWLDLAKFGRNDPYMASLKVVQTVLVCCISRSHRLKIVF